MQTIKKLQAAVILLIALHSISAAQVQLLQPVYKENLGDGWAQNTVNTAIFRHHGLVTQGDYQLGCYYQDTENIVIIKRSLKDNSIIKHSIPGNYTIRDAHNVICMGIDADGIIHIAYDHHGSRLHYRRSAHPMDITEWTGELPMTDECENSVTYPQFLMAPENPSSPDQPGDLYFIYRYRDSGNGDICLKAYDVKTRTWQDRAMRFVKGTEQKPWTSNGYWNHPAFDTEGNIILTWTWRIQGGPAGYVNNQNISFAKSSDGGKTWQTSRRDTLALPITPTNAEVIWAIPPASSLINQCSSAVDSNNNLHVVYYADDPDGIPQYYHLWTDGSVWHNEIVSKRQNDFELKGTGTLQIPISRPEIVIDKQNCVYIIYRGDLSQQKLAMTKLKPPYDPETSEQYVLWDENIENAEPIIDRARWQRDGILTMLIQKNTQADQEGLVTVKDEPVWLAEWKIAEEK